MTGADIEQRLTLASFVGTLAFSRLVLVCIFAATLASFLKGGGRLPVVLAIAALGAAYWAQSIYTRGDLVRGMPWQIASVVFAAFAALLFLLGV